MKLVNTLMTALGLLALVNVAQAAVITTVEWESKPGAPWSYGSAQTDIDCAMPPSPSGGCAFRITYPAGTYDTSFSAGRTAYALSGEPTDLYVGAWMRYSDPFAFHPIGHKVNFFVLAGANPGCRQAGHVKIRPHVPQPSCMELLSLDLEEYRGRNRQYR